MTIISLLILILSIVAHEVAHGIAALWQGDRTAKEAGRLTLNPMAHIDPIGSVILPLTMFFIGSPFLFGWAKPVPVNPYYFRNVRYGETLVAFAGPLVNLIFVAVFTLLINFGNFGQNFIDVASMIVLINLVLAFFNLMPIPPLDGSKIFFTLIPQRFYKLRQSLESKSFIFWFIAIIIIWQFFYPLVWWLYGVLV